MKLRSDQRRAVDHVMRGKARSVLVVAPTATGKTPILAEIARRWAARGKRVLVVAHRAELLTQAADHLREKGLSVGIVKSGWRHLADSAAPVQVASVLTLIRREYPKADLVMIDEAHRSTAKTYRQIVDAYPHAKIVGFTATPISASDSSSLGDVFDDLYESIRPSEAVAREIVAPWEGTVWVPPSLSSVRKVGGDFNTAQLGRVMSKRTVVGDIVDGWKRRAEGRSTIVFAATVKQARRIAKAFVKAKVKADWLSGDSRAERRAEVLGRFAAGDVPVLVNVGLFTEGVNVPRVKCIVLARPTYSTTLYLQMVGRGRRLYNGETCIIHDHGGLFGTHQGPDDDRDWKLGGKSRGERQVACRACGRVRKASIAKCPKGCKFEGHEANNEPTTILHGYEYDAQQFLAARNAKIQEAKRLYDGGTSLPGAAKAVGLGIHFLRRVAQLLKWKTHPPGRVRTVDRDELKRLWLTNLPIAEIAKRLGCSCSQVSTTARRELNLPPTLPGARLPGKSARLIRGRVELEPKRNDRIVRLRKAGKSTEAIARAMGVSESVVYRVFTIRGVRDGRRLSRSAR